MDGGAEPNDAFKRPTYVKGLDTEKQPDVRALSIAFDLFILSTTVEAA